MKKYKPFTKENFAFICPMQWDDMSPSKAGRFCEKCQQDVVDVSDCSLEEVAVMQRKDPHLCVAIKTLVTAGVALSMAACAPEPKPVYEHTAGVPVAPPQKADDKKNHKPTAVLKGKTKGKGSKPQCALPKNQKIK